MKLYVGNLSFDITERTLRELFEPFGTVSEVKLIMDRETGQSRGFGFVTMGNVSEGNAAIKGLHGKDKGGRKLQVTPSCDKMRAAGQWNQAWDPFSDLAPVWTEDFMAAEIMIYTSVVMPPKLMELLSIAFNTSYTHMYAPGTRRHIKAALRHGATIAEIIEVLKLCVVQGVQAFNLGVPMLAKERRHAIGRRAIR